MISFEGVSAAFDGFPALKGIDLHVTDGSLCVLVGPSGSGKSTLLRLVNRLVEPSAGTVRVRGQDVAALDPVRLRRSDRKSTRLNSSRANISYAVFCLKKKKNSYIYYT